MQAIILAAGMGKRLGKLTQDNTKCMVEVAGERIIDRQLKELLSLNLTRIIIVCGYKAKSLENHIKNAYSNRHIILEYNPLYASTNNIYSLSLVKNYLEEDNTILLESDIIFESGVLQELQINPYPNLAVVSKYEHWMHGTMLEIDNDNSITNIVSEDTFDFNSSNKYYKTVNIYKFSKEFSRSRYIPFMEAYIHAFGKNQYYEEVLNVLSVIDKTGLRCFPLTDEKWYEIDDFQDLTIANILFSDNILLEYQQCYGGYWRFPQLLDFCYLVNPYFPTEKFKQELKALSDRLLTSYPSGRKTNDVLASQFIGIDEKYISVANGTSEHISVLCNILKGKIGIIYPTFEEYPNSFEKDNIVPFINDKDNFSYSIEDLQNFYENKNISTIFIINPDNPTGNYIEKKYILKLLEWTKRKEICIIIDESFVDFSTNSCKDTLLTDSILEDNPHLIVVKSISKSYGVPGIRLGVLATSNNEVIDRVRKQLPIWNINSYAEYFMQLIIGHTDDYRSACSLFHDERKRFYEELKHIKFLHIFHSEGNCFLCRILIKYTATELTSLLLNQFGVLIKDCSAKSGIEGQNLIRISIRCREDNDKLIAILKSLDT